jgi:hypothetical protein
MKNVPTGFHTASIIGGGTLNFPTGSQSSVATKSPVAIPSLFIPTVIIGFIAFGVFVAL